MRYFDDLTFVNYGNAEHVAGGTWHRRFDGYFGVQYHYAGNVEAWVNEHDKECVTGPHVFITYPGVEFNYYAPPGEFRSQAHVCFRGERVDRYLRDGLLELRQKELFHKIYDPDRFFQTMRKLFSLLKVPGDSPHARAVLVLEELLLQLQEQPEFPVKVYEMYGERLRQLRDRVAGNPGDNWDFERVSASMSLSYVHFRRLFRQFTGWSPGQFLLECRLRHAEKMLTGGALRISEIAAVCGFEDEFHFSRIFKKHRSLSPSSFRRRYGVQE